jgi:hypothetical protein
MLEFRVALVLLLATAGFAWAQTPTGRPDDSPLVRIVISTPSPSSSNSETKAPVEAPPVWEVVSAGDPNLNEALWQRTWGQAGFYVYPVGNKMAPNGIPYNPVFALDLMLNVELTRDRRWYLFTDTRFWAQRATAGVTNTDQGVFDFSKRQFDLDGGVAWNYHGPWEARAELYSFNNLNRGNNLAQPFGYNDGFEMENRYYLPSTNFDNGLYRFLSVGYYFTKSLTGGDGKLFNPSLFARASLALDILPERLYLYSDTTFITRRPITGKLLLADWGIAWRPFENIADLEFRVGADNTYDMQVGIWRSLFYGNVRIVW